MTILDIAAIQESLRAFQLDGWLLYDFRGSNPLARRILQLDDRSVGSRRCFYFVPSAGEPVRLVHRIESAMLDHLPGETLVYLTWQELEQRVAQLVGGLQRVAMEYSHRAANPYVSRVDAGTVELVTASGPQVVSSGDLIQQFESTWDERQWQLHLEAARHTDAAFALAWQLIIEHARAGRKLTETRVQSAIMDYFQKNRLATCHPPIVAVGPHSGDPHFEPNARDDAAIGEDDFVLIDLWAKVDCAAAVYSDLTRVAFVGREVPAKYEHIFQIVARARDAAIEVVRCAMADGRDLAGWEVDQAARDVIAAAGYADFFIHRTGHSIGEEIHGNGAHMDNLEMHDERRILPRTCFSIEPGIYLPEFGIRSEVNVYVDSARVVHVTGGSPQQSIRPLLAP